MDILGLNERVYTMYSRSTRLKHCLTHSCVPLILTAFLGVSGCAEIKENNWFDAEKHDHLDRKQNLSRDDYRTMTADQVEKLEPHFEGEPQTKVDLGEPPIPEM